jgi:pSer/pThr/pTyr-binding forkhead associated (FHA) protein
MDEIVIALMSGPKDGETLSFQTLLSVSKPIEISIGRREGCDVCLSYDSQVSREHARIVYDGHAFWLEDNHSTNGTFIEDQKITGRAALEPGQLFRIGRTWLRVEPILQFNITSGDLPF